MAFSLRQKVRIHFTCTKSCYLCQEFHFSSFASFFSYTVKVLIAFYENRLKDHYVVTSPVLQGLRALVSLYMLDFQYQGRPPQKNADLFLCDSKVDGFEFPLLRLWPRVTSCFSYLFADKVHRVASWLGRGHAEGCVSGCSCSGETSS